MRSNGLKSNGPLQFMLSRIEQRIFPSKMKENPTFWGVLGRKWVKMGPKNTKIGPKGTFFAKNQGQQVPSVGVILVLGKILTNVPQIT